MGVKYSPPRTLEVHLACLRNCRHLNCQGIRQYPVDCFRTRQTDLYCVQGGREYVLTFCKSSHVVFLSFSFENLPESEKNPHFTVCKYSPSLGDQLVRVKELNTKYHMQGDLQKVVFSFLHCDRKPEAVFKLYISGRIANRYFSESIAFRVVPPRLLTLQGASRGNGGSL
jgi:hypothetical protein